ncbi:MAG: peptidoglycan DD-metalloendopeptidase family protein [Magnetovibrio sp.]|nr:peptidoglycan DD-metalloendopeptidase family protein [Magnetovibrio sp.]
MLLRGMAIATVLITGAILNSNYTDGDAAVATAAHEGLAAASAASKTDTYISTAQSPGDRARIGMAPLSIGNPTTAAALDALDSRASANAQITPRIDSDRNAGLGDIIITPPSTYQTALMIKSGDTLSKVLRRAGAQPSDAEAAIRSLKGIYDPRKLRAGQNINVIFAPSGTTDSQDRFAGFEIPLDYATRIAVAPAPQGGFKAHEFERQLKTQNIRAQGVIDWSLFKAGSDAGVPNRVMAELVRVFSWDVDFQRDIRKNDSFEVMFESKVDEEGQVVHNGKIIFAALTLSGERKPIYLHTLKGGIADYFDEAGQSAKKALMRTPIDGARLSSSFGKRKHPILGYTKKHSGTDFAAPPGTPIYAAGDGTIDSSGWNGGYGKYVRIRHNSEYSTAYAHMKAIKRGMGKGKRVRQGQVIGFVGTTGRSTGPHLHYEIIRRGVKVNPMRVKMPSGQKLKGSELARFTKNRNALKLQWASLRDPAQQLVQR